jgi:hypothetical protein
MVFEGSGEMRRNLEKNAAVRSGSLAQDATTVSLRYL